jgi:hypothetical protein
MPSYPSYAIACSLMLGCVLLPQSAQAQPGWAVLRGDQGTSVPYPADIFTQRVTEGDTPGQVLATADGRARLHLFVRTNERNETPEQFIRRVIVDDRRNLTYERVTRNFLVFSAPEGERILYRRCNFPRDGRIHCVDLRYPRGEKRAWDAIVTRISLSLRPR